MDKESKLINILISYLLNRLKKVFKRKKIVKFRKILKFQESLFENIESGVIVVDVPEFKGKFEFDIRSSILQRILITKEYENEFVSIAEKYIDRQKDVIDVGANIGLYSVLFAKIIERTKRVLAIEPIPSMIELLKRNITRNMCYKNIIVYEGIAINKEENYTINTIDGLEEYSSLGKLIHPDTYDKNYKSLTVSGISVDILVDEYSLNPGFIKIDTEGSEFKVLLGCEYTINTYRPLILSEVSDVFLHEQGDSWNAFMSYLHDHNYILLNAYNLEIIKGLNTTEIFAIPKEYLNQIRPINIKNPSTLLQRKNYLD